MATAEDVVQKSPPDPRVCINFSELCGRAEDACRGLSEEEVHAISPESLDRAINLPA